jgi:hypothetical protein
MYNYTSRCDALAISVDWGQYGMCVSSDHAIPKKVWRTNGFIFATTRVEYSVIERIQRRLSQKKSTSMNLALRGHRTVAGRWRASRLSYVPFISELNRFHVQDGWQWQLRVERSSAGAWTSIVPTVD